MVDYYVVFNGYGFAGDATLAIARVLALYLNVTFKRIDVDNNGDSSGALQINGGRGYAVGAADVLEGIEAVDFGWDSIYCESCCGCYDFVNEDDVYYGADDLPYCENCYHERFEYCDACGETYRRESVRYVEAARESLCDWCYNQRYVSCDRCEDDIPKGEQIELEHEVICKKCKG